MSSIFEEIVKSDTSADNRKLVVQPSFLNFDKLEIKIKNEINAMEQLTQEDNEKSLNSNAENWMFYLKKNIMDEYENMKKNLKEISKNIIIKEIQSFEREMNILKEQTMENQSLINKLKNDIVDYKNNVKFLSEKLSNGRNKKVEIQCIYKWRLQLEQLHRQNFCEKIAIKYHESALKRKALSGLKRNLELSWKNRNNSQLERNAQSICKDLVDEYEKQIVELKFEISKLQNENVAMQSSRSSTQDAVKKALMRGVCALNMETMSILNQNGIIDENGHENNYISTARKSNLSTDLHIVNKDDQPRFPLSKYSREMDIQNSLPYNYTENDQSKNGKLKILKEDVGSSKIGLSQYQPSIMLDRSNNNTVKHLNQNETKFSNYKLPSAKSSAITIQAGNPTGSHTQSCSLNFNVSVHKHNTEQLSSNSYHKRNVEIFPDRKNFNK